MNMKMKSKSYSKGYAAGGKMPGMTLAGLRAGAKAKGYKLIKG